MLRLNLQRTTVLSGDSVHSTIRVRESVFSRPVPPFVCRRQAAFGYEQKFTCCRNRRLDIFRFRKNLGTLGWTEMSYISGTTDRMISLQENSQHYFQRPDAKSYSVDRNATSMTGYAARFLVNKQKGNVLFNSSFAVIDPKFDQNDLGFLSRADVINMHIGGGYKWTEVSSFYRQLGAIAAGYQSFNFDGNVTGRGAFYEVWAEFLNYYYFDIWDGIIRNHQYSKDRGGPITLNLPLSN